MQRSLIRMVATVILLGSCTDPTELYCTDEARPGVIVHVLDATSGGELAGASGTLRDGEYVETLDAAQTALFGAFERAGTYRVEVMRADYQPWVEEGVRVTRDRCHVRTVDREARLTPAP